MIVVTRLNDSQFAVNPDLIERIYANPDTTLVMVDGKPAMAEPKSAKGRRSLILAPDVLDALRAHRARQAADPLLMPDPERAPARATLAYYNQVGDPSL